MATFRNRPTSTENYRNPTHQEYVTGDGWKSGESDTDAPGAKKAKAAGEEGKAGLKAETARPQASADMTGNQSMPEQKTKLGVTCVTIKPNGGQMGQIKGGDPLGYLGHFRSPKVLKEGHNQGPPFPTSGAGDMPPPNTAAPSATSTAPVASKPARPVYDPKLNPVGAARQAGANPAEMRAAKVAARAIPAGQRRATASAARQAAKTENIAGRQSAGAARSEAVGGAKAGLKSAIGDVKAARMGLRSAIKGGDVTGAGTAFGKLKAARGEKREARMGVRKARSAKY